jgi:hypothetical protein
VRADQVQYWKAPFVPCGLLHAPGSPYGLFKRVSRIVAWELTRQDTGSNCSRGCTASYAEVRWWREQAHTNEFSYGDTRGPLYPGSGLDPDLDWI